jgi:hypothetical protein
MGRNRAIATWVYSKSTTNAGDRYLGEQQVEDCEFPLLLVGVCRFPSAYSVYVQDLSVQPHVHRTVTFQTPAVLARLWHKVSRPARLGQATLQDYYLVRYKSRDLVRHDSFHGCHDAQCLYWAASQVKAPSPQCW